MALRGSVVECLGMAPESAPPITRLLDDWRAGDQTAASELVAAVYGELRRIAAVYIGREHRPVTLQPTALVNELCLDLLSRTPVSCETRAHFLNLAAQQMRRLLVDYARRRKGLKRGGGHIHFTLDEARDHAIPIDDRLADLDDALTRLEALDPRAASVVEMRFFGGLMEQEIADALAVSLATVKRDWDFARSWLLVQLDADQQNK